MHMKAVGVVIVAGLLAACAQVPRPSTYPYSFQKQMQAAEHWQRLAAQIADQLQQTGDADQLEKSRDPVYIPQDAPLSEDQSTFGVAFRTFLKTELAKRYIPVRPYDAGARTVDWIVQPVLHEAHRHKPHLPFPLFLLEPLAFLFSPGVLTGRLPHNEVIVTVSITQDGAWPWRTSKVFYVNDPDVWHYQPPTPQPPTALAGVFASDTPQCANTVIRAQCPFYQYGVPAAMEQKTTIRWGKGETSYTCAETAGALLVGTIGCRT